MSAYFGGMNEATAADRGDKASECQRERVRCEWSVSEDGNFIGLDLIPYTHSGECR